MDSPDPTKLREKFQEYQRLYATDSEDRIWSAVAEAFNIAGDGPNTVAALETACALNPEWGRYRLDLAKASLRAHKWQRAAAELERCADLDASGCRSEHFAENYLYYLGYALFGMRRFKEAAEAWRAADHVIQYWGSPEPLKDFHLHRGWAYHLEGDYLDAIEAYRRGLVAPGPGDCALEDDMDPELVDQSQDAMNPQIENYHDMAKAGEKVDPGQLVATPYTL